MKFQIRNALSEIEKEIVTYKGLKIRNQATLDDKGELL